jgi:phosphate-selective porin OprO/OprP
MRMEVSGELKTRMNLKRNLLIATVVGSLAAGQTVKADDTLDGIKALREQIEELDQKVRVLERKRELDQDAAVETAKTTPRIAVGNSGLSVSSGDTNFVFQLHGLIQADNRTFVNDGGIVGNDTFLLHRARPIFSGTLYRDFDFLFMPDFGVSTSPQPGNPTPVIQDVYLNYRYRPWLQLRAGKFKTPIGLEQLQSDAVTSFNERSLATALTPNRDLGFQLWGDVADGRLSYAVGVFTGIADGRNTFNADFEDHREIAARLFAQPFKTAGPAALRGLGFGVAGSWGNVSSNALGLSNGFLTDGQQQFFAYTNNVVANGTHWRVSPQGYYYYGPLSLLGEYVISDQRVQRNIGMNVFTADLQNTAWQISGGWVLTGEEASYTGVVPKHPFDLSAGQWGAFQLVARYAELDIDNAAFPTFANPGASASAAHSWAVGLNWYLNKNLRLNASYSRTTFTGGGVAGTSTTAPAVVTRQPEQTIFTRLQLAF